MRDDDVVAESLKQENPCASIDTLNLHIAYCTYKAMHPDTKPEDTVWWFKRVKLWTAEYNYKFGKETTHGRPAERVAEGNPST